MVDVFSAASSTTAFLGAEWVGFETMIEYVEMIGNNPALHYDQTLQPHARCRGMTMRFEQVREYIIHFFGLPWHNRIWTLQEYAQSKHVVLHRTLQGALLSRYLVNVGAHLTKCCSSHDLYPAYTTYGFEILGKMRAAFAFDTVLALLRTRQCYDPRDKVYGLWSYGPRENRWPSLTPNHSFSTLEVYQKVFESSTMPGTLDILSFNAGSRHLDLGLPSFVPDWTAAMTPYDFETFSNRISVLTAAGYKASKESVPDFSISNSGVGKTPGIIVDIIAVLQQNDYSSEKERL